MDEAQEASGPLSFEELAALLDYVEDLEITHPSKVEIIAIGETGCLVRVLAGDGEVESRVIER